MLRTLSFCCGFFLLIVAAHTQPTADAPNLARDARAALQKGIAYFHSLAIEGGYVYHYSLDLKETWGEGKTDNRTIEVQPPGTPAVGMSFLAAWRATKEPAFLQAAQDAGSALIRGQNALGGWEHKIYFDRPTGRSVSFDDDQTQSAIRFLIELDREIDRPALSEAVEKALDMMLATQLKDGGWPHQYPAQGNYHDYATFNDGGINDCIRVMLEAHRQYGKEEYLQSLRKVGRFLMISQLPPPQPGWAQQYTEYLQPAWARAFEPPAVCPQVTIRNIHSLLDLYLHTGRREYLEPIPDALSWLDASRMTNGKWGRFLEIGTNKALYYDRGRIRVDSLEELSLERRTGYSYEQDLSAPLAAARSRFEGIAEASFAAFPASESAPPSREALLAKRESLAASVREIIAAQDAQGRWISVQDRFRKEVPGQIWNGEYRTEDRISSAVFNRNVGVLCAFLALEEALKGG